MLVLSYAVAEAKPKYAAPATQIPAHKRTTPKSTTAKLELRDCRAEPVDEPHNYCNVTMATKNTVALVCMRHRGANTTSLGPHKNACIL